jgi:hypothetical protein
MDDVFGEPQSDRETTIRKTIMFLDTTFRIFDLLYGETSDMDKAMFLHHAYEKLGIAS